jgi:hypothetical protein
MGSAIFMAARLRGAGSGRTMPSIGWECRTPTADWRSDITARGREDSIEGPGAVSEGSEVVSEVSAVVNEAPAVAGISARARAGGRRQSASGPKDSSVAIPEATTAPLEASERAAQRAFKATMDSRVSTAAALEVEDLTASEAAEVDSMAAVEGDKGRLCESLLHC